MIAVIGAGRIRHVMQNLYKLDEVFWMDKEYKVRGICRKQSVTSDSASRRGKIR